jgi:hypothetical protein
VAGRQIAERGVYAFLAGLWPEVQVDPAPCQFELARPHDHELRLGPDDRFVLTPSLYVWPHSRVNCDRPWPLGLVFPAPFIAQLHRPAIPPAELVRLLRALGDEGRLRGLGVVVTQYLGRTALCKGIFTGLQPRRLGKLVVGLAGDWTASEESRLLERRGHERLRAPRRRPWP